MKRNFKGQAAMEYLMTYGWAILVLVIVIAALYYLLPKTQETCLFQQGFACDGMAQIYVNSDGNVYLSVNLNNRLGYRLNDVTAICTDAGAGDVTESLFTGTVTPVSPVLSDDVGSGQTFTLIDVPCIKSGGSPVSSNPGAGFKGIIALRYSIDGDPNPNIKRIATGTISGTVLEG
ncbi:MAG: hypothetical protein WC501_01525 [Candidatus Micrarchaeia archaeon]